MAIDEGFTAPCPTRIPDARTLTIELACPCATLAYPPGGVLGPRRTTDWELVWILEGHVKWTLGSRSWQLDPGHIALRHPGTRETYQWDSQGQTRLVYFHFHAREAGKPLVRDPDWPSVVALPDNDVVRPLFRHLLWLSSQPHDRRFGLESEAARLLFLAVLSGQYKTAVEPARKLPEPVEKALRFAGEQLRQSGQSQGKPDLSLSTLSRAAGVSQRHLVRLFHEAVGRSPAETVRLLRLQAAASLLVRSELRIQEIAHKLAFESAFHFSRRFTAAYGVSPRTFRQQHQASGSWPTSAIKLDILTEPFVTP